MTLAAWLYASAACLAAGAVCALQAAASSTRPCRSLPDALLYCALGLGLLIAFAALAYSGPEALKAALPL